MTCEWTLDGKTAKRPTEVPNCAFDRLVVRVGGEDVLGIVENVLRLVEVPVAADATVTKWHA